MQKSLHNYYGGDIPFEELSNFIEPIKMNINIPLINFYNIAKGPDYSTVFGELYNINKSLLSNIQILNYVITGTDFYKLAAVTYNAHSTGYDFRINPVEVVNRVYKYFDIPYQVPFINLDSKFGIDYFKDFVRSFTYDIRRTSLDYKKIRIVEEINENIDKIIAYYDIDLTGLLERVIVPKDALFYLAYKSLVNYEKTADDKYLIYPCEYYNHVSHMNTSPYPHKIELDGRRLWFSDFRGEYEFLAGANYIPDTEKYILNDDELLLAWDILSPGMVETELRDVYERVRGENNVDYQKYQKLFEVKMNYYMNSPFVKNISGLYGLLGYMGFLYKNEYLVFDKFYNSETIDPSKKTILTHAEAIFAFPSDRFDVACNDKQYIIKEKETDKRIRKINHTPNYSFIGKLDGVIQGPNLSTSTLDIEIEKYKKKVLIREK